MQPESLLIRPLVFADIAGIIALFRRSVREVASQHYNREQVLAWAPDEIDAAIWAGRYRERRGWVAEIGGHLAGFGEVRHADHLDMLYVGPAHQRRGVASALLSRIEEAVRDLRRGSAPMKLTVEASITARPFFERREFRLIAEQVVSLRGQELINYRMVKSLS